MTEVPRAIPELTEEGIIDMVKEIFKSDNEFIKSFDNKYQVISTNQCKNDNDKKKQSALIRKAKQALACALVTQDRSGRVSTSGEEQNIKISNSGAVKPENTSGPNTGTDDDVIPPKRKQEIEAAKKRLAKNRGDSIASGEISKEGLEGSERCNDQDYLELFGPGGEYCTAPKGQEDKCKPGAFMSQGKKIAACTKQLKEEERARKYKKAKKQRADHRAVMEGINACGKKTDPDYKECMQKIQEEKNSRQRESTS